MPPLSASLAVLAAPLLLAAGLPQLTLLFVAIKGLVTEEGA
jgi:hypothetical protein